MLLFAVDLIPHHLKAQQGVKNKGSAIGPGPRKAPPLPSTHTSIPGKEHIITHPAYKLS